MTCLEMLFKVQQEIERALFDLHHSVDPSTEQQRYYRQAMGQIKAAQTWIKKAEEIK